MLYLIYLRQVGALALRKALSRVHLFTLLFCWCIAAYAQEVVTKIDFTGSLEFYDLSTWGFILIWSGAGGVGRFNTDFKAGTINLNAGDIFRLAFASVSAGLLVFAVIEMVCQYYNYLPPSSVIGAAVLVGSYFNSRTFDLAMDAITSFVQWTANKLPRKE